jgi:hypothetical protein
MENKLNYRNLFIKRKEIKIKNKDNTANSMDTTPVAFSFSLDPKVGKLINNIYKNNFMSSYINKNMFNSKLIKKYQHLYNKRNEGSIKNKIFNKATCINDSMDNSINKEKKNNTTLIKTFNKTKDNNNCLIIHRKIFVLSKISNIKPDRINLNNQRKNKTTSLINSASSKKYQTIFTKCKMDEIKIKEKSQEPGPNFEYLSSKYYKNNNIKIEESKETQTPRKIFTNAEIKKTEFHNNTLNEQYLKTDTSNYNHTLSVLLPKFVNIPNLENVKNFKSIYKPTFYCQKNDVKNKINLMMQNNKSNTFEKNILLNSYNRNNKNTNNKKPLLNKIISKNKEHNLKSIGIKFVSVNLNGLAKIPNRLVQYDKYGNKLKEFVNNNNRNRLLSQSDAFQLMKKNMMNKFIIIKNKNKKYNN